MNLEKLKAEVKNYIKYNKDYRYSRICISESGFFCYYEHDCWMIPINFYYESEAQEAMRILLWNSIERQLRKGTML